MMTKIKIKLINVHCTMSFEDLIRYYSETSLNWGRYLAIFFFVRRLYMLTEVSTCKTIIIDIVQYPEKCSNISILAYIIPYRNI